MRQHETRKRHGRPQFDVPPPTSLSRPTSANTKIKHKDDDKEKDQKNPVNQTSVVSTGGIQLQAKTLQAVSQGGYCRSTRAAEYLNNWDFLNDTTRALIMECPFVKKRYRMEILTNHL